MRDLLNEALAGARLAERGRILAARGLWYDTLALVSDWITRYPGEPARRGQRAGLLEQVGLTDVAAYERRSVGQTAGD